MFEDVLLYVDDDRFIVLKYNFATIWNYKDIVCLMSQLVSVQDIISTTKNGLEMGIFRVSHSTLCSILLSDTRMYIFSWFSS